MGRQPADALPGVIRVNLNTAFIGGGMGFLTAFVIDINKWAKSNRRFNWKTAAKRWAAGTVTGLALALGVNQSGL